MTTQFVFEIVVKWKESCNAATAVSPTTWDPLVHVTILFFEE